MFKFQMEALVNWDLSTELTRYCAKIDDLIFKHFRLDSPVVVAALEGVNISDEDTTSLIGLYKSVGWDLTIEHARNRPDGRTVITIK